jgi:UDPglucose 6-dehydrogenase
MVKIVIAGYGPVGQAIENVLDFRLRDIEVSIDDPMKGRHLYRDEHIDPPDGVIVCVATPMREDGSCNTDNVRDVFEKYGDTKYLIKSAVDPEWLVKESSVRKLRVTCSPEFLGSSNAFRNPIEEFANQTYAVYGGNDPRWWSDLFAPSLPRCTNIKFCTLEQAAFAKYVENCFLATKVTFFNEMYRIYQSLGFDGFDQMVDAITVDPRIGRSHTAVPGPDGKFGFGGHCLPKDMAALRYIASESPLLDAVTDVNEAHRK